MFLLQIELPVVLIALMLAFACPRLGWNWFEAAEGRFLAIANRRKLAVALTGVLAVAVRLALLPILPVPGPSIEDEFGYLLLSDTFAHGRLTNPTNPMWKHFENLQIFWQPTYTSKYYPAQGLFMAFGQVFLGHPFWGVVLSVALMCAAITWMLQAWFPAGWALLGGLLAIIRIGSFSYWANSYWGGAVAALGGALVLGALPRMKERQRPRDAILMGLGFALLANSRPYEGLFFGIPVAIALVVWIWKRRGPEQLGASIRRVVVPLLAVLMLTVAGMGYYNWRVTGSPEQLPYVHYERTYNPVPYFQWKPLRKVAPYRHRCFQEYLDGLSMFQYERSHTLVGFAAIKALDVFFFWMFFVGPLFTVPFILAWAIAPYGFSWRSLKPNTRFLALVGGVTLAAEAVPLWFYPHYAAPITCVFLATLLIALRSIRRSSAGLFFSRAVPCACVLLFALRAGAGVFHWPMLSKWPQGDAPTWCSINPMNPGRAQVLSKLKKEPGQQIVIVRDGPDHNVFYNEWVYNRADLESAKVIWAHDMGPKENAELICYFKNRQVWLVDADDQSPKVEPYKGRSQ